MTNSFRCAQAVAAAATLLVASAHAQFCFDSGSTIVGESWSPSPLALGCAHQPAWPIWAQFTPAHRTPAPHVGFRPGRAEAVAVLLVTFKCTGLLLQPIAVGEVRAQGYVIDMPEEPCT